MTKIEHTNIIIDDFSIAKKETSRVYLHILTHIHTDHLTGLHDGWNYGPIYCTQQTKALLLNRFPNIPCIKVLERNVPTELKMSSTMQMLSVMVTFLDANHIGGSIMVLLEGYMGRILYTGDTRFERRLFSQYSHLYPFHLSNQEFKNCSKPIDVLYLDNTFLKKKYDFPPKQAVLEQLLEYIQHLLDINNHTRIFIGIDSYGKEEVLVAIARHFSMYVVVDKHRYDGIIAMGYDRELFTTNQNEGFVQVVRKNQLQDFIAKTKDSIGILMSGWVNRPKYMFNGNIYCLPYSLHSNYREIHDFVDSIRPSFIYPIVHEYPGEDRFYYADKQIDKRDLVFDQGIIDQHNDRTYKKELEELRRLYCSPISKQYEHFSNDVGLQQKIAKNLLPPNMSEYLTNQKLATPTHSAFSYRKKYKLDNPRNEQEITMFKNQIKNKKIVIEGEIETAEEEQKECIEISDGPYSIKKDEKGRLLINVDSDDISSDETKLVQIHLSCSVRRKSGSRRSDNKQKGSNKKPNNSNLTEKTRKCFANTNLINGFSKSISTKKSLDTLSGSKQERPVLQNSRPQTLKRVNRKVSISDINLQELDSIQIVTNERRIKSYFENNPKDRNIVEQYLRKFY